jgi:putative aldouronate transport system permease protein
MKTGSIRGHSFFKNLVRSKEFLLMLLLPVFYLIINNYLPMIGTIIAFKDINYIDGIFGSPWVGFKNFYYLFTTEDAFIITRNTILYNLSFIALNIIIPVSLALLINELRGRLLPRMYQTVLLFPYFISMVVVSYLVFALLSHENGLMNRTVLPLLHMEPINWYNEPKYWPFILPAVHVWKTAGYTTIVYLASLSGIDQQYYEAIAIDGGGKWKQIRHVSLPFLKPVIIIMTLFEIGKIFNSDFGLFYQVPLQSGSLFTVTNVIDTYVYRGLIQTNDLGMASAAGFYQAIVGLILVLVVNAVIRKINPENALF